MGRKIMTINNMEEIKALFDAFAIVTIKNGQKDKISSLSCLGFDENEEVYTFYIKVHRESKNDELGVVEIEKGRKFDSVHLEFLEYMVLTVRGKTDTDESMVEVAKKLNKEGKIKNNDYSEN